MWASKSGFVEKRTTKHPHLHRALGEFESGEKLNVNASCVLADSAWFGNIGVEAEVEIGVVEAEVKVAGESCTNMIFGLLKSLNLGHPEFLLVRENKN